MIITGVEHSIGDNNTWETSVMAQIYLIQPPKRVAAIPQTFTPRPPAIPRPANELLPFSLGAGGVFGGPLIPFTGTSVPVDSYGLWLYLAWNQGATGAAVHYKNLTASGVGSWDGIANKGQFLLGIKGNLVGGVVIDIGGYKITRGTGHQASINPLVDQLFQSNPKIVSTAIVQCWQQTYANKLKGAQNLRTGQTRSGDRIEDIDALLTQYARPSEGLTADRFKTFAAIENNKLSDTETGVKYQGMFQMDNRDNPIFMKILRESNPKKSPYVDDKGKTYTYYDPKILIPKAAEQIVLNFKSFLSAAKATVADFRSD
jgi:hypothetical protein